MTNFAEALRKGIEDDKRAREARAQMDGVLAIASKQVSDFMNAELTLQIEDVDQPVMATGVSVSRRVAPALTAKRRDGRFKVLAEVRFGALGYPVSLRWANDSLTAETRADFESILQELLGHRETGAKIRALCEAEMESRLA